MKGRSFSNGNGQSMSNGPGSGPAAVTVSGVPLQPVPEVYRDLAPAGS